MNDKPIANNGWRIRRSRLVARLTPQPPASSLQAATYSAQPAALARAAAACLGLLALSACGNIEPWVKPYERQALADPIMSFNANPVSSTYIDHVHDAREGARGATGGGGGGCGCN